MINLNDLERFRKEIEPYLKNFEIKYKFFEEGDLGSLNQVEFNSTLIGGNADFWGSGWLGIFLWNFVEQVELINVLIEPNQEREKSIAFEKLKNLLPSCSALSPKHPR